MLNNYLNAGLSAIRRNPGLAALLFLVNAVLAYAVSAPIGAAFNASFGETGWVPELIEGMDLVLLVDFFEKNSGLLPTVVALLAWMVPLMFVWSAASGVGLVHALRDGGGRPFWSGVTGYLWPGLGLALIYLVCVVGWTIAVGVASFVATLIWPGEVAAYWSFFVVGPLVWATGLALIDMMQDYARFGLVARSMGVFESFIFGLSAPVKLNRTFIVYVTWLLPAAFLTMMPTFVAAWVGGALLVYLAQQVFLVARAAITIGWMASQVALAEQQVPAVPALAEGTAPTTEPEGQA